MSIIKYLIQKMDLCLPQAFPRSYAGIAVNIGILDPQTLFYARLLIADLKLATLVRNLIAIKLYN
jgi:hypothetical protein